MLTSCKESYDHPRQHIKKQRQYFANKGPSSQGYGFSSGHVWMWELDYKESWALKNWCFWTVVTLESPLDWKEIQPVHPKGDQSWVFIGRTDVKAETPILWPPDAKSWLIWKAPDAGKDWGQEEKGTAEDEMAEWHHQLDGHEFEWTPGVGDGQGGLVCCRPWGHKESDMTELNWTDDNFIFSFFKRTFILFSIAAVPVYTPTNSLGEQKFILKGRKREPEWTPGNHRVCKNVLTPLCHLSWDFPALKNSEWKGDSVQLFLKRI